MKNFSILSLALTLLIVSCKTKTTSPPSPPPVEVIDYIVEPKTIPRVYEFIGFAESSHAVEIRARVEGYLDKIAYNEGQLVHEGDLLFQLDPKQFEAKVEQAKSEVSKQEAVLENAKLTVNRLKPLYEQKAASKKDLDNAIANELSAEASLQAAKAQLLDSEINLGYTTIRSPITGYADKSKYREGALITPGSDSLMTTISILNPIWVYFTVSENDILRSLKEQKQQELKLPYAVESSLTLPKENFLDVEAVLSNGIVFPYKGNVDFSAPTYDQSTGTLLARAVFPNPDALLRPGQFVRIKIFGAMRPNAILVPQRALLQKKNGMFVYIIDKDNKVKAQDVSIGDWYGNFQIITNGLKPGDRLVVDGIDKVHPGTIVKVVDTWKPKEDAENVHSTQGQ